MSLYTDPELALAVLRGDVEGLARPPAHPEPPKPDPRKAPPVQASELTLAIKGVAIRLGVSEAEAQNMVIQQAGGHLDAFKADVEYARKLSQDRADALAAAQYENSPEGREEAAKAAIAEREALQARARLADALLEEEGWTQADLEATPTADRIAAAGLDPDRPKQVPIRLVSKSGSSMVADLSDPSSMAPPPEEPS